MSPLGKPDPDTGEVVAASRHYTGKTLGAVGVWVCPGCGVKNTTEFTQGCPSCGAGKPGELKKPQAQKPQVKPGHSRGPSPQAPRPSVAPPASPPASYTAPTPSQRGVPEGAVRVVRLIEYLIAPGKLQPGEDVLRRSLVGTRLFDWGQMTATIVDSLDARQEDMLRIAKYQPGVWLGAPSVLDEPGGVQKVMENMLRRPPKPQTPQAPPPPPQAPAPEPEPPTPPDVGITVSAEYAEHAAAYVEQWGYRFANTVALALSSIAEELRGNMEPQKFLTAEECLEFAQALMNAIPNEWEGDLEAEDADSGEVWVGGEASGDARP